MELDRFLIMLTVAGITVVSLGLFIAPFIDFYGVDDPQISSLDNLDLMINNTAEIEDDLKGTNVLTNQSAGRFEKIGALGDFILSSAYNVFVGGLTMTAVLFDILRILGERTGLTWVFVSIGGILIIALLYSLAKLFLQVNLK